jgi:hypothetical protein
VGPSTIRPNIDPSLVEAEQERQREVAISTNLENAARLDAVAYELRRENTEICGEKIEPVIGVSAMNRGMFDREFRDAR